MVDAQGPRSSLVAAWANFGSGPSNGDISAIALTSSACRTSVKSVKDPQLWGSARNCHSWGLAPCKNQYPGTVCLAVLWLFLLLQVTH